MTADVVIVTYRSGERVLRCLERLGSQRVPHTVTVVDNASGDGTVDRVRAAFPDVRALQLSENVGFGRACGIGAAGGTGDAVVLINDDMEPEPQFLEALLAPLAADDRVGMVAGLTLLPDGSGRVDGFGIELDAALSAYNRLRLRRPDEERGRLAMPSGGAAAYRRVAWEAARGFDERLFAYGEDVDLGLRLRLAGWRAAEAPQARAVHLGGASFGVDSPLQRRLAGFARGFLLRRYGVLTSRAAGRALIVEALVVVFGLVRHRTLVPLTARLAGWRAAGRERLPVPPGAVDERIGLGEALRRLRRAR